MNDFRGGGKTGKFSCNRTRKTEKFVYGRVRRKTVERPAPSLFRGWPRPGADGMSRGNLALPGAAVTAKAAAIGGATHMGRTGSIPAIATLFLRFLWGVRGAVSWQERPPALYSFIFHSRVRESQLRKSLASMKELTGMILCAPHWAQVTHTPSGRISTSKFRLVSGGHLQ